MVFELSKISLALLANPKAVIIVPLPHTFRNTLIALASRFCTTPEEFKVYSQNLGHENVLTTFTSYGYVDELRQGEIVRNFKMKKAESESETSALLKEMMKKIEGLENAKK